MRPLDPDEARTLHVIATETVGEYVRTGESAPVTTDVPRLLERQGAFVTLRVDGLLRGCIGMVEGLAPLAETVREMAIAAAAKDPRFPPIRPDELDHLDVSVSVMDLPAPVEKVENIEVGRDGLIVRRGSRQGLLLPQVAIEQGWDRETFLTHTSIKAGLEGDAWRDPATTILSFRAQVIDARG